MKLTQHCKSTILQLKKRKKIQTLPVIYLLSYFGQDEISFSFMTTKSLCALELPAFPHIPQASRPGARAVSSLLPPVPTEPLLFHPQVIEAHPLTPWSPFFPPQEKATSFFQLTRPKNFGVILDCSFSHLLHPIHQLSLHLLKIHPPLSSSIASPLIQASIFSYQHPCNVLPSGLPASVFPFTTISS